MGLRSFEANEQTPALLLVKIMHSAEWQHKQQWLQSAGHCDESSNDICA